MALSFILGFSLATNSTRILCALYLLLISFIGCKSTPVVPHQPDDIDNLELWQKDLFYRIVNFIKYGEEPLNISTPAPPLDIANDTIEDHFPDVNFPFGKAGRLIFPAVITLYLFLVLTVVCDCFLIPCIQAISIKLDLTLDIAGATLMAAASSSPEFFINLFATFVTSSDVGVGTVLGTGLYILFIVPAFCILFSSKKSLKVEAWAITRDSFIYLCSVVLLVIILEDSRVYWYEACYLIAFYFAYLIILSFDSNLQYFWQVFRLRVRRFWYNTSINEPLQPLLSKAAKPLRPTVSMSVEDIFSVIEDHTPEFYTMGPWPSEHGWTTKIQWLLMYPIISVLRSTIPTYWERKFKQIYVLTFTMCVAWIAILTYGIAWMIIYIGNEISLPESVMGLTLIAVGMSIPETISGVIVSSQGYGTMAISNALGSNTFTVLMCLSIPWLVKILFFSTSSGQSIPYITVNSKGVSYNTWILLAALIVFYATFVLNQLKLKAKGGWWYLVMYAVFIGTSVFVEIKFA